MEPQAAGLAVERRGGPAPCAPYTLVRCSPSGQRRQGTAAWGPGETRPQRQEHPKSRLVRPCPWGAQARFGSYPKMCPRSTHGTSSVLGPHWPNLLRMTGGRWTNAKAGKTASPRLPGCWRHGEAGGVAAARCCGPEKALRLGYCAQSSWQAPEEALWRSAPLNRASTEAWLKGHVPSRDQPAPGLGSRSWRRDSWAGSRHADATLLCSYPRSA